MKTEKINSQNYYVKKNNDLPIPFQAPREPPAWKGVRSAMRWLPPCSQTIDIVPVAPLQLGSEDCLRLDVYTPEAATPGQNLPVLVFLHGGAYYYGNKNDYDPEFLVTKNVITVIINYRVGVFGFLCLNGVANLGLKDQVAALKWIQKNIAAFGGDPDNVTLSGQSAGASAAAMHLLSKSSKGLFHKLILMSGNPFTPWSFNPEPETPAFQDVSKRKRISNVEDVYNYFATAPVRDIMSVSMDTSINPRYFKYSPCVDSNFSDPFFRDTPYNIIKSGNFNKVPILTGITNVEGLLFYGLHSAETVKDLERNFLEKIPSVFSWCSKKDREQIAQKLRDNFFGKEGIKMSAYRSLIDFYSVWIANATAAAFVDLMVEHSEQPVYRYVFSYEGDRNFAKAIFGSRVSVPGASHSDDLFYVFKPAGISLLLTNRDKRFIDRMTTMFTNFMKFGDPTPCKSKLLPNKWPPVTASDPVALRLDRELTVIRPSRTKHEEFFLSLLCTYGHDGYVPCKSQKRCNLD
ncbi:acetylcholinesterase-like [Ostrinia furnacalis]|uniref:acetylcholinesterase-like n=1 Tax=Ostrinia furnacalis TaxID=93504 RepID=UPI0010399F97|nr:acetylcholinesterase-like [Ostrinia furnacalis]